MQKLFITLALIFGLIGLMVLSPGCADQNPTKTSTKLLMESSNQAPDVSSYADYHNSEVERLIRLDRRTGSLSRHLISDFQAILEEMARRDPDMATDSEDIQRGRETLAVLLRIQSAGHQPQEIIRVLKRCFADFANRTDTHPAIIKGIEEALALLIAQNAQPLNNQLALLKSLTDEMGSPEEKGVVGVFLGSYERFLSKRYEDPNQPWWWPWVIIHDVIGSFIGGPGVGAIYSAWVELMYIDIFPHGYHP